MSAPEALTGLHEALVADGGLLADVAVAPADGAGELGRTVARGPRAAADPAAYALVVEAIREGYLLHYGDGATGPRVVRTDDRDLALLAGDRLYALGLGRLAQLGDVAAVEALAQLIGLSAQARAADDEDLAEAVWTAGVVQVGWGDDAALAGAREQARSGDPSAARALRDAARDAAPDVAPPR